MPNTGELAFANAGHNPPILVRASGEAEMLEGGGPVLGILPIAPYSEMRTHLDHGDMLVLYSDGVTEANNPDYDEFDEERFIEVLKAHRTEPASGDRGGRDRVADRVRRRRAAGRRYHAGGGEAACRCSPTWCRSGCWAKRNAPRTSASASI